MWNVLTDAEKKLIKQTGVYLVQSAPGMNDRYSPSQQKIYVEHLHNIYAIRTELIHVFQNSRGYLNGDYDLSVEFEQNICYFLNLAADGQRFAPPSWIAPQDGAAFVEWANACRTEYGINRAEFYSRLEEFYKSFSYKNLQNKKNDYPYHWEELFSQMGITFR